MPDLLADRYEIGEQIGAGGISDVYVAVDTRLGRLVAIKFLRAAVGDPRAVARFERESRLAASFSHPNAVAIYDVGARGAQPYLVLELVDGESLAQLLSRRGSIDPGEAVAIIEQVLGALGAAHAQGLVHRDVKPANILLTREHVAKLADFGIAKAVADANAGLTATGELLGTPRYLSPEQVAGHPATAQSDLYAVGVVLYEMLAGAPPFDAETPIATALAHQHDRVPPLATRRAGLDPRLVATVERALEKDPTRRFSSAEEMRDALGESADAAANLTVPLRVASSSAETATLPVARQRQRSGAKPWIIGAVVALAIVLGVIAIVALSNGDDQNAGTSNVRITESPTLAPTTSRPPTTTAGSSTTPRTILPSTLDGLAALLAANPQAYGSHGKDFLNDLRVLQSATNVPGKSGAKSVPKDAQKAINDATKWIADGTLDRTFGTQAILVLQRYV